MSTPIAIVHINKIGAARRQLDAAIRMFLIDEDELAIHTVAAAAFRVLRDVTSKRGKQFTAELFRAAIFRIARRYSEGKIPDDELVLVESMGLMPKIKSIAADVRSQGAKFDRSRIPVEVDGRADQAIWPSTVSNFLKHADRDTDRLLAAHEIDNERLLMGACSAYLQLMHKPTPEIMAFSALWLTENGAKDDEIEPEIFDLVSRLRAASNRAERYHLCTNFIRNAKK